MADLTGALQAAAGTAASAGGAADPNFNQTVLLLHGDGTNGAQNNTFLDSSTNNFTITRNGNTTQGTFSPFSSEAGKWSNYFDGSGDYFTFADSADWAFGSGNFTLEAWVYRTVGSATQMIAIQSDNATAAGSAWSLYITSGNKLQSYVYYGSSFIGLTSSANVPQNEWVHIALVRTSGTVSQYINGTRDGTSGSLSTNSLNDVAQTVGVGGTNAGGDLLTGYLSNVRVIKGAGPYDATSSTLTVPTSPLSVSTSNQKLLTCYSNRFVDANTATTAKTITVAGNTSVQPFSPFAPSAAYSASVNGGSGYFDGSGDYLEVPDDADWQISTDYTMEAWVYPTGGAGAFRGVLAHYTDGTNFWFFGLNDSNQVVFNEYVSGSLVIPVTTAGTVPLNEWSHIAFTLSGSTATCYVNGVAGSTTTKSGTSGDFTSTLKIGSNGNATGSFFTGYISNVRVVKGTAITPPSGGPTAPLTAVSGTSLLCNFTNAGIFDNTGKNNLETVADAQIDTTTKKYGTGSMEFDGTGDYLTLSGQPQNFVFGTGDFTIEFWYYPASVSGAETIYEGRPASTNGVYPAIYRNGADIIYYVDDADRITGTSALSATTWKHIAVSRSGTSTKMFVDGTQVGSTYTDTNNYLSPTIGPRIGINAFTSATMNGFIDDLRITKGVARYTTTFTPPTAALPDL